MPRMSPMDRAFFLLETEQRPMNIGALVVLKGRRAARGRPGDELVRRMFAALSARRSTSAWPRMSLAGWPVLVEDDRIDPAEQVFRHDLPAGSDVPALFERVCRCTRSARSLRPLWEVHVFDGLARNRVASISRRTMG